MRFPAAGVIGTALLFVSATASVAQVASEPSASAFDTRWTAWLGCWQSVDADNAALTCVIPAAGSSGVDLLSVVDGKIVGRRPLLADARRHPMNEQGCDGTRIAQWAPRGKRVYVRADYTCGETQASLSTLLTLTTSGEWLEVETVRAGDGTLERVSHLRDVGVPRGVPAEIANVVTGRRLAISTARAAVTAPSSVNDVLEALRYVDSTTVRGWLLESGQHFSLSGEQAAQLMHASVPQSVMRAVMGSSQQPVGGSAEAARAASDAYLSNRSGSETYAIVVTAAAPEPRRPSYCEYAWCYYGDPYPVYSRYVPVAYPYPYVYSPYPAYSPYPHRYAEPLSRGYQNSYGSPRETPRQQEPVGFRPRGGQPAGFGPVTHQPSSPVPRTGGRRP